MKKILPLALILLVSTACLAGGSIFGGHKTRSSNPDGVSSINVHICGSLSCPEVVIHEGNCDLVPNTTMKYGVCMCEEGYHVVGRECVLKEDKCEDVVLTECQKSCDPVTGDITDEADGAPCDGGTCEFGECALKCLVTGTCEGNTCKNGGDYPHCWYQCKCPESAGMEGASICACGPDMDKIVCNNYVCAAPKEGEVCHCAEYGGKQGTGTNACACAEGLDQIVCGNRACTIQKEGEVCRCSMNGQYENACACAESLNQIVCGEEACTVIPTD